MKNDNILSLISHSPQEMMTGIATRVKERRLELRYTQRELAIRAGLPLPTYRRFERSGEIALRGLVMLGIALDATNEFSTLFSSKSYASIDDLLLSTGKKAQRGKRRK
ncbi:MAG: helix-turn-helix transcriptional regulator [Paludibacter sp.]|nr:helix-turn-helix transcriptional regulator [Paludibacter sp.]